MKIFSIKDHRLVGVEFRQSPNRGGALPKRVPLLVMHDTAGHLDTAGTVDWLTSRTARASAHLVIGIDGEMVQLVPFDRQAWHAGPSEWKGRGYVNNRSIGIEIVNPGHLEGPASGRGGRAWFKTRFERPEFDVEYVPKSESHPAGWWLHYAPEQIEAVQAVADAIVAAYGVEEILTHWMISPGRKIDTNPLFPLERIRENALGAAGHLTETKMRQRHGSRPAAERPPARSALGHIDMDALTAPHGSGYAGSVSWRLTANGLEVAGEVQRTAGAPATVRRIWQEFGAHMVKWGGHYGVPVELLVMTAAVETRGRADAVREEPGYVSDEATPEKASPGLMQTLIATARWVLKDNSIDRAWLLEPENSIRVAADYMALQSARTGFDPPKVAAGYNAGSLRRDNGAGNRFKLLVHPKGTGAYCEAITQWFNDCFAMFEADGGAPHCSFFAHLNARPPQRWAPKSLIGQIIAAILRLFTKET